MEQVNQIWKDSGYGGAARLWTLVRGKVDGVKLKDVEEFVANQEVAQLHKRAPKDSHSHHITSAGNTLDYQADLLDMSKYARKNSGMNWCLLVEDIFNRKAFAAPLKTKSPNDVLPALNKAFQEMGKPQLTLVTDNGTEFKGVVGKRLKDLHIVHHTVEVGDHRTLGMIDSLSRFFKNALHKHFTHSQETNWIDYLPKLVNSYNNTPHSSLKDMSPLEAEVRETDTRNDAYALVQKDAKPSQFAVGDHVRVMKKKRVFDKGYEVRYSLARYTIESTDGKYYVLNDGSRHREQELRKIPDKKAEVPVTVEGKASDVEEVKMADVGVEEKKVAEVRDVAKDAKFAHKTDQILKHKEGIEQSNRRSGLRERAPVSLLEHSRFGKLHGYL